jgi:hypothetical protein
MQAAASSGLRFQRRPGRSVEYAMPSSSEPPSVASRGCEPEAAPMARDAAPVAATTARPVATLKSPQASGR